MKRYPVKHMDEIHIGNSGILMAYPVRLIILGCSEKSREKIRSNNSYTQMHTCVSQWAFRMVAILAILLSGPMASAQEYIAGLKGTQAWTRSDLTPGLSCMIQNNEDKSCSIQIIAMKDGHFDFETSPVGIYLTDSGTTRIEDTTIPSLIVGGKTYKKIHYSKRLAHMAGEPIYVEVWQPVDNGIEYTIIALAPVKRHKLVKDFITYNLILLPLPESTEDTFIQAVENTNAMMQKAGGAKLADEVKMISCVADKINKEFIRTYQFYPGVPDDYIEDFTTLDASYEMLEYEVANVPIVKNAVDLDYSLTIIWKDENGKPIASHTFKHDPAEGLYPILNY